MTDITTIPIDELEDDLRASQVDIIVCKLALAVGTTKYSDGSVQERLDVNEAIVEKITKELNRRKAAEVEL